MISYCRQDTDLYYNFLESPEGHQFLHRYWQNRRRPTTSTAVYDDPTRRWLFYKWMNDVTTTCMNEEITRADVPLTQFADSRPIEHRLRYMLLPIQIDNRAIFKCQLDNFILELTGNAASDYRCSVHGHYLLESRDRDNHGSTDNDAAGACTITNNNGIPPATFSSHGFNNDMWPIIGNHDDHRFKSHEDDNTLIPTNKVMVYIPPPSVTQQRSQGNGFQPHHATSPPARVPISISSDSTMINEWWNALTFWEGVRNQDVPVLVQPTNKQGMVTAHHSTVANNVLVRNEAQALQSIQNGEAIGNLASIDRNTTLRFHGIDVDKLPARLPLTRPASPNDTSGLSYREAGSSIYPQALKEIKAAPFVNFEKPLPPLPADSRISSVIDSDMSLSFAQNSRSSGVPSLTFSDNSSVPTTGVPSVQSSIGRVEGIELLKGFVDYGQADWEANCQN